MEEEPKRKPRKYRDEACGLTAPAVRRLCASVGAGRVRSTLHMDVRECMAQFIHMVLDRAVDIVHADGLMTFRARDVRAALAALGIDADTLLERATHARRHGAEIGDASGSCRDSAEGGGAPPAWAEDEAVDFVHAGEGGTDESTAYAGPTRAEAAGDEAAGERCVDPASSGGQTHDVDAGDADPDRIAWVNVFPRVAFERLAREATGWLGPRMLPTLHFKREAMQLLQAATEAYVSVLLFLANRVRVLDRKKTLVWAHVEFILVTRAWLRRI